MIQELAIALFQQAHLTLEQGARLIGIAPDELQQLLANHNLVVSQAIAVDPDDTPTEIVLEGLRQGLHG